MLYFPPLLRTRVGCILAALTVVSYMAIPPCSTPELVATHLLLQTLPFLPLQAGGTRSYTTDREAAGRKPVCLGSSLQLQDWKGELGAQTPWFSPCLEQGTLGVGCKGGGVMCL